MSALIPVVVCPTVLLFLFFISNKGSDLQPKYIQVSDWELLGYSLFLWLVFIVFCINSLNSSGVLGISPQSEVRLNLVAGICVLVSEPVFLFINARIRKNRPKKVLLRKIGQTVTEPAPGVSGQSGLPPQAELRNYLEEPINDFPWLRAYTEEENRRGLLALRELAQRIRTRRGQLLHCNYLFHIFTAQRALGMGQYSLACHELFDVVHFHQTPEVTALIYKMIEPYFDEVTPLVQKQERTRCPHCGNPCHAEDRYCRFCGERLFSRFSELPEDLQKNIVKQTERFIDAYLQG